MKTRPNDPCGVASIGSKMMTASSLNRSWSVLVLLCCQLVNDDHAVS